MITHTHTSTYNATTFADPYKKCRQCGDWITGALDAPGPVILVPCEHQSDYRDVCPSWGPVDGCRCEPIDHATRVAIALENRAEGFMSYLRPAGALTEGEER